MPHRRGQAVRRGDQEGQDEQPQVEIARARPCEREEARDGHRVVDELRRPLGQPWGGRERFAPQQKVNQGDAGDGAEHLGNQRRERAAAVHGRARDDDDGEGRRRVREEAEGEAAQRDALAGDSPARGDGQE